MTVMSDLALRARGRAHDATSPTRADQLVRRKRVRVALGPDALAGDTIAENTVLVVPAHVTDGIQIVSIKIVTGAAVTTSATNYKLLAVSKRDGAGGSATGVGGIHTDAAATSHTIGGIACKGTGTTVAGVAYAMTLSGTTSVLQVPAGGVLTLTQTVANAGVALPGCTIEVVYDEL